MTKRKGPWEGERKEASKFSSRERRLSTRQVLVTIINYNALLLGGGGRGGIEEIVTIFSLM